MSLTCLNSAVSLFVLLCNLLSGGLLLFIFCSVLFFNLLLGGLLLSSSSLICCQEVFCFRSSASAFAFPEVL